MRANHPKHYKTSANVHTSAYINIDTELDPRKVISIGGADAIGPNTVNINVNTHRHGQSTHGIAVGMHTNIDIHANNTQRCKQADRHKNYIDKAVSTRPRST